MKRRILRRLLIKEISGVDKSCQEGADVVLLKRAPDVRQERRADIMAEANRALQKFNPNQPRDDSGQWSGGGSFHGTREAFHDPARTTPLYTTTSRSQAFAYARGAHLGGSGSGTPHVKEFSRRSGKTTRIDRDIATAMANDGDLDTAIDRAIGRAKTTGARYVEYMHPNAGEQGEHLVRIAIFPHEDLRHVRTLQKFNPHHDPADGRFTSGPGGSGSSAGGSTSSTSSSTSTSTATAITPAARDETLRWAQIALRTVKIASWAVAAVPMIAAFSAALPVGVGFAATAALGVLVSRAALTSTAAFLVFDQTLSALIRHRERELSKSAPEADPVLSTLLALQAELRANKHKLTNTEDTAMKTEDNDTAKSGYGESFDAHVAAAIAKGYPATVAGSLVLQQFGSHPPSLADMHKSRASAANFMSEVDKLLAKGCSRQEAMRRVRRECPDAYREFTEG